MIRKFEKKFKKVRLKMNLEKTRHIMVEADGKDIDTENIGEKH